VAGSGLGEIVRAYFEEDLPDHWFEIADEIVGLLKARTKGPSEGFAILEFMLECSRLEAIAKPWLGKTLQQSLKRYRMPTKDM
jgi:hypothetical protein